jgi:hypothetical protein
MIRNGFPVFCARWMRAKQFARNSEMVISFIRLNEIDRQHSQNRQFESKDAAHPIRKERG